MTQFVDARFKMFKSQDLENGLFDLTFEIGGKPIYAHKFMLGSVSDVFKRMISDVWNKKESIPITTSYADFYEFLNFIYSGKCKLNDENIFTMIDLSEFYHGRSLQQKCDKYLSRKKYTSENILMFFQKLFNYSLPLFEKTLSKLVKEKRINFFESEGFLESPKEMIIKLITFKDRFVSEERLFKKVYEWAEIRAVKKQEVSNVENFNMNDAIKTEISEFLPYINFKKMNLKFLHIFVVQRGFLFTYAELSDILDNAKPDLKVKVTNSFGKSIHCMLPSDSDVIKNVKTLKGFPSVNFAQQWASWETQFAIPSTPSQLTIRNGVEWYLIYYPSGEICLMHHALLRPSYYLIAEMTDENYGFDFARSCRIEVE